MGRMMRIVYGSTPSGCCATIATAREGASVILLEPTHQRSSSIFGVILEVCYYVHYVFTYIARFEDLAYYQH